MADQPSTAQSILMCAWPEQPSLRTDLLRLALRQGLDSDSGLALSYAEASLPLLDALLLKAEPTQEGPGTAIGIFSLEDSPEMFFSLRLPEILPSILFAHDASFPHYYLSRHAHERSAHRLGHLLEEKFGRGLLPLAESFIRYSSSDVLERLSPWTLPLQWQEHLPIVTSAHLKKFIPNAHLCPLPIPRIIRSAPLKDEFLITYSSEYPLLDRTELIEEVLGELRDQGLSFKARKIASRSTQKEQSTPAWVEVLHPNTLQEYFDALIGTNLFLGLRVDEYLGHSPLTLLALSAEIPCVLSRTQATAASFEAFSPDTAFFLRTGFGEAERLGELLKELLSSPENADAPLGLRARRGGEYIARFHDPATFTEQFYSILRSHLFALAQRLESKRLSWSCERERLLNQQLNSLQSKRSDFLLSAPIHLAAHSLRLTRARTHDFFNP